MKATVATRKCTSPCQLMVEGGPAGVPGGKPSTGSAEKSVSWLLSRKPLVMWKEPKPASMLVVAEAGGSRMPSDYVTVRKGASGWVVR